MALLVHPGLGSTDMGARYIARDDISELLLASLAPENNILGLTPVGAEFVGDQLNWVVDQRTVDRELARHRVSAFFKKLNPFAAAAAPGGSPSLSMMSDMLAPLTNVEELDKRIKEREAKAKATALLTACGLALRSFD